MYYHDDGVFTVIIRPFHLIWKNNCERLSFKLRYSSYQRSLYKLVSEWFSWKRNILYQKYTRYVILYVKKSIISICVYFDWRKERETYQDDWMTWTNRVFIHSSNEGKIIFGYINKNTFHFLVIFDVSYSLMFPLVK